MITAYERTKEWREHNPERLRAQRHRYESRARTDDEIRLRRLDVKRRYVSQPHVKARIKAEKAAWMRKPENKAHYLQYYREQNLREPWRLLLAKAKCRCKTTRYEFTLTRGWAEARWTGQCELTGLTFDIGKGVTTIRSPSLDRIDSSKGYVDGNCRFICWGLNRFKNCDSDADMIAIARALIERI
jgi:hypothetical protein